MLNHQKTWGQKTNRGNGFAAVLGSITTKLLVSILFPLVIVLLIIGVIMGTRVWNTVSGQIRDNITISAQSAANQVDAYFQEFMGDAKGLASSFTMKTMLADDTLSSMELSPLYEQVIQELGEIQQSNSDIMTVWVANFQLGDVLRNNRELVTAASGFDYTTRNWYTMAKAQQQTVVTPAYEDATTGTMIVTVASPIYVNGTMMGIIGINISTDSLNNSLSKIKIGQNGYIVLFDSNRNILTHPSAEALNMNLADISYSQNLKTALTNGETMEAVKFERSGSNYYGSTAYLEDLGFITLGVLPNAEYQAYVTAITRVIVIGFVLCAVLLAVIVVLMSMSIIRPLTKLDKAAAQLADGELSIVLDVRGRDEVSKLGKSIQRIVDRLKTYIDYIAEIEQILQQIGQGNLEFSLNQDYAGEFVKIKKALLQIQDNLSHTIGSITMSAQQVNAGAEQIASGAQALAQGATEQASSVQQLSATVQDLSTQAVEKSNEAMGAEQQLEQIEQMIQDSNHKMERLMEAMNDISEQSNAIGTIIKTIDDIAFQTNILALNAAVEAARAGTAGKGFAVVADEVRNLAGKSAAAAKQTNDLIQNSVAAVKTGKSFTDEMASTLAEIQQNVLRVVKTIEDVTNAYHEQAQQLGEISSGVDQISCVVQTNSATAEQSAAASKELSNQVNVVREQIAHFRCKGCPQSSYLESAPSANPMTSATANDSYGKY